MKRTIVILAGPTASGKTDIAIALAHKLQGEIVSADSMQIYKYMNIGSAKPTESELAQATHYMVDEIDPASDFSVAMYQKKARAYIEQIFSKGKLPIIAGGTGLYINALLYEMDFAKKPSESVYRKQLQEEAKQFGSGYLHEKLVKLDAAAAARIHPNNQQKLIRALEVLETTGNGIPDFKESFVKTTAYEPILIGLFREREELYGRIDRRVDQMMKAGLLAEIQGLLDRGLDEDHISMKGIGYKELIGYLHGSYDLEEAIRLIKRNSRHYAKRQMTWFRRYEDMQWFDLSGYAHPLDGEKEMELYIRSKQQEVCHE